MQNIRKAKTIIFLALFIMLPTGFSDKASALENLTDRGIQSAIMADLERNDAVPAHLIDVIVRDGIVTLDGSIYNILARDRAVEIARSIKGVRSVVDLIEVKPIERPDNEIKKDVETALVMDPAADSYEILVEVNDGRVILTGTVESYGEKELSARVAKGVKGVIAVENDITVNFVSDRPDFEVQAEIERLLEAEVLIDQRKINVAVNEGQVSLSGKVGSAVEKVHAETVSWVAGVRSINNELEVDWALRDEAKRDGIMMGRSDAEIEKAIQDAFSYDPRVRLFDIGVAVDEGTVTLAGAVDNLRAKMAAERDARHTPGVWSIINEISVRPMPYVQDIIIAKRVKEALDRNPYVERYDFIVSSFNGKVILYGVTDTLFEKKTAGEAAGSVKGVVEVQNNVTVREEWTPRDDREIKRDIEKQLFWSPFVDIDGVKVEVNDGVAILSGTVDTWNEYITAAENAFEGGARAVKNNLEVREFDRP